jgi:hypothetical protein
LINRGAASELQSDVRATEGVRLIIEDEWPVLR